MYGRAKVFCVYRYGDSHSETKQKLWTPFGPRITSGPYFKRSSVDQPCVSSLSKNEWALSVDFSFECMVMNLQLLLQTWNNVWHRWQFFWRRTRTHRGLSISVLQSPITAEWIDKPLRRQMKYFVRVKSTQLQGVRVYLKSFYTVEWWCECGQTLSPSSENQT